LARDYPALVEKLAALLARARENTQKVERVNARLPTDAAPILVAELVARGLGKFVKKGVEAPSIVKAARLRAFKFNSHAAFACPRPVDRRAELVGDR
jgi:hypothetical protein